nr:hypothetical protein [Tanacetum cinerariifolium]
METRGRKKVVGEPAPPARDPRDVEMIERLQQRIQKLELQQLRPDSPTEEAKTEPNVWDDESVDVNPFGGEKPKYVNRLYQPRRNDLVVDRDDSIRSLGLKIENLEFTALKVEKQIKAKSKGSTSRSTPPTRIVSPPPLPQPRLQFSICMSYKDEVWCEVIPMDAAHILLGRPWKFDRKTKHDGFQNTYSFKKDGFAMPNKPTYRMNLKEFAELQRQVTELLEKGAVNKITIKYRFPISRLNDLLDQLHNSTIFSKIDLRSGYHQIQMRPGDEWKTTFKTRDGLSLEQHLSYLRQIFSVLRAQKLYANGRKCHFLNFSSIIVPLIECMKDGRFTWTSEATKAFDILKAKVTEAPVLALPNFDEVFQFSKLDGYLFKGVRLCIPLCSLREVIILEGHAGGLTGHFGSDKTLALLCEQFYLPKMERNVNRLLERCRTCHIAKTHSSNAGLYTPLSVPIVPWEDVDAVFLYYVC